MMEVQIPNLAQEWEAAKTKCGSNIARRKVEHERPSCAPAAAPRARAFSDGDVVGRSPRDSGICSPRVYNTKHETHAVPKLSQGNRIGERTIRKLSDSRTRRFRQE